MSATTDVQWKVEPSQPPAGKKEPKGEKVFVLIPHGSAPKPKKEAHSFLVTISTVPMAPRLTFGDQPTVLRRIAADSWLFSVNANWSPASAKEILLYADSSTSDPIQLGDIQLQMAPPGQCYPTYTSFEEFSHRMRQVDQQFFQPENFDFATHQRMTRRVFPEIDLLFLYHLLATFDDNPDATKAKIKEHFAQHSATDAIDQILDKFKATTMLNAVEGLLVRSNTRLNSWANSSSPPELGDWTEVNLTEEHAVLLAKAIASIFTFHCRNYDGASYEPETARLCVVFFASGLSRMYTEPGSNYAGQVLSTAFNAEPNSDQFRAFAEFADLVIRNLPHKLHPDELKFWQKIFPALVVTIELFTRVYVPYPTSAESSDDSASPAQLMRMLQHGRDPRPDETLVQKVMNRIAYFANEIPLFIPTDGIDPFWGALLWNLQLPDSTGVLPNSSWSKGEKPGPGNNTTTGKKAPVSQTKGKKTPRT